jgi:hypothetical protein
MTQPAKRIPRWLTIDLLVIVISLAIIGIGIGIGDCSLATNLNRIGSDSYPTIQIGTSRLPAFRTVRFS